MATTEDRSSASRPTAEEVVAQMMDSAEKVLEEIMELKDSVAAERQELIDSVAAERQERIDCMAALRRERVDDLNFVLGRLIGVETRLINEKENILNNDFLTEAYECYDRCIQGMNDMVFNTALAETIDDEDKKKLKANGLGYISRLLAPGNDLDAHIETLRTRALSVLTPRQQSLCSTLINLQEQLKPIQHSLYHPRPDRKTAWACISPRLDLPDKFTLYHFLNSNPMRLPTKADQRISKPDLYLFETAPYESVAMREEGLTALKVDNDYDKAWLGIRCPQVDVP